MISADGILRTFARHPMIAGRPPVRPHGGTNRDLTAILWETGHSRIMWIVGA